MPDLPLYPAAVKTEDLVQTAASVVAAPKALLPKNKKAYKQQWGADRIGLPSAWGIATGAASKDKAVTVCIVDSGVDYK